MCVFFQFAYVKIDTVKRKMAVKPSLFFWQVRHFSAVTEPCVVCLLFTQTGVNGYAAVLLRAEVTLCFVKSHLPSCCAPGERAFRTLQSLSAGGVAKTSHYTVQE